MTTSLRVVCRGLREARDSVLGDQHRQVLMSQPCAVEGRGLLHNPAVDISDEGQPLDPVWLEINNNVCGGLAGAPSASSVAAKFIGAGWSSRSASWESYEVETGWCRIEVDPAEGDTLLNGVVDPRRFEDLAALLTRFGLPFSLELCDDDGELLREIEAGAPSALQDAVPRPLSRLLARPGLWSRPGGRTRFRSG